jgi:cobalt-zinc-cadmium efflux system outer membrane protein
MRAVFVRAALVLFLIPASVRAQTVMLTEADALARLSNQSPRVRALRSAIEIARVDVLAAGRLPNPRVNWDRQSVAGVAENLLTVSQPLPITGRRRLDIEAATAGVAATENRAEDELRRLRADLRLAFAELQAAQIREREVTRAGERLRGLVDVLAKREAQGDAAGFDRLRAEREALDLEADRVVTATERAQAQASLSTFFADVRDPSVLVAVETPPSPTPVPPLDALMELAETTRGQLTAFRSEIEAARLSERAATRSLVPEPELFLGTKTSTASGGEIGSAITIGGGDIGPVFGVHATIPLFDRARPERALAAARASQAQAGAEAFRIVLRGQIAALSAAVNARREGAARYRAEAVNRADEIERIAQVSYDAGERGILELLDAYRIGSSARVRQAMLDAGVRQAEIELEFASGWEVR